MSFFNFSPKKSKTTDIISEFRVDSSEANHPLEVNTSLPPEPPDEISFAQIYKNANLTFSGCSVEQLEIIFQNPTIINKPIEVQTTAILLYLSLNRLTVDMPISDVAQKCQTLTEYEKSLQENYQKTEIAANNQILKIEEEIAQFVSKKRKEIEELKEGVIRAQGQFENFSQRAKVEKIRLKSIVKPLLPDLSTQDQDVVFSSSFLNEELTDR